MKTNAFVIDANTFISIFLSKKESTVVQAYKKVWTNGIIVMSIDTFKDLSDAFVRPKFDKYLSLNDRLKILEALKSVVHLKQITVTVAVCRDPKDDKYLELAVSSNAVCIITGDKDLLSLHPFNDIPILNASDFLTKF